jgi:hypothetical protein
MTFLTVHTFVLPVKLEPLVLLRLMLECVLLPLVLYRMTAIAFPLLELHLMYVMMTVTAEIVF